MEKNEKKRKRLEEEAARVIEAQNNVDPELDALFGDNPEAVVEPSEEVNVQMDKLSEEGERIEREAIDPEIEALFDDNHVGEETQSAEDRLESQAPSEKRQRRDHALHERASDGERLREMREELGIANDFELPGFIYRPLQTMAWGSYIMDDTKFIHQEMVRFAYSCSIDEDKDQLMAGPYIVRFDDATINEELGQELNDDLPGEVLENALMELCVEGAA